MWEIDFIHHGFQEELEQKERAIQEYRHMLENHRFVTEESNERDRHDDHRAVDGRQATIRKATDLLNNVELEEKERHILSLSQQVLTSYSPPQIQRRFIQHNVPSTFRCPNWRTSMLP